MRAAGTTLSLDELSAETGRLAAAWPTAPVMLRSGRLLVAVEADASGIVLDDGSGDVEDELEEARDELEEARDELDEFVDLVKRIASGDIKGAAVRRESIELLARFGVSAAA